MMSLGSSQSCVAHLAHMASHAALLIADFLLTFTDEVQRIWRRRFTGAAVVFFVTRYAAVFERIILIISVVIPASQDKVREAIALPISPFNVNCPFAISEVCCGLRCV